MNKRTELRKSEKKVRKLFVVDIENAIGSGMISRESCRKAMERIYEDFKPQDSDLTVIGVSHPDNFLAVKDWNAGARVVARWGHNGADLALEEVLCKENVERRFAEVIIVSGDGLFSEQAAKLKALGLKVVIDAPARLLSRRLAFSGSVVNLAPSMFAA